MAPRIAIPMPHASDPEYALRAIPQYEHAVEAAGGQPVRIPLNQSPAGVLKLVDSCDGVLLPGTKADIDPSRFHANRSPHTAAADPNRDEVDNLLLDYAYRERLPVLGICYGLQSLNVYRGGSLVQHIPDFLPEQTRARVNHEAGKNVAIAHNVKIEPLSLLAGVVDGGLQGRNIADRKTHPPSVAKNQDLTVPVNSSHHQSADSIGRGLRIVARCAEDNIIEALEGTSPDHFVLAVQWHPERSVDDDEPSRAIFRAFVNAATERRLQDAGKET